MTGVVLVHGMWHEPRHFDPVTELLRKSGVRVTVPELHRGSLDADTAEAQRAVDAEPTPPLVLGHSYGGAVITGLTGARRLVYVAAYVPDESESAASLGSTELLGRAVRRGPEGTTVLDPEAAIPALYQDVPGAVRDWAVPLLRPQAKACPKGSPRRQAWRDIPSTYVVCEQDRTIAPDTQRAMAARCGEVRFWPTGHSPALSRPDLVTDLVTELLAG